MVPASKLAEPHWYEVRVLPLEVRIVPRHGPWVHGQQQPLFAAYVTFASFALQTKVAQYPTPYFICKYLAIHDLPPHSFHSHFTAVTFTFT